MPSLIRSILLQRRASGANPFLDGLVSVWHLDSDFTDAYGSNDLTDNNTVQSDAGQLGTAALFDSANSEYLSIASNSTLQTGDIAFTLACWVRLNATTLQAILGKWGDVSNTREYLIQHRTSPTQFSFWISANGTSATGVLAPTPSPTATGTWYFVVAYHDPVANVIGISVDGAAATTAAHSTGAYTDAAAFEIGRSESGQYLSARVDEVAIWKNRVLTAGEIATLYNSGAGKKVVP